MPDANAAPVSVGRSIGPLRLPPLDRLTLALYCGASNDHNPIHVDPDAARAAGLDDVIAHGMLSMAYVGRLIAEWAPQDRVRSFKCRFVGMLRVGDTPSVAGSVSEVLEHEGERVARIVLTLSDGDGQEKARAEALIALSDRA